MSMSVGLHFPHSLLTAKDESPHTHRAALWLYRTSALTLPSDDDFSLRDQTQTKSPQYYSQ